MHYLCIYNHETLVIDCERAFDTEDEAKAEYPMWNLECLNRGGAWKAYIGPEPFKFPEVPDEI
jgi:hypothetical protein